MKVLKFLISIGILISLLFSEVQAQDLRDFLSGEFRGDLTTLTYRDNPNSNEISAHDYRTRLGRFERGIRAFSLRGVQNNNNLIDLIFDAGLAFEHWYMSFEMLMICQRDYAGLVEVAKEYEILLGRTCLLDDTNCNAFAQDLLVIRDYWVPFNVTFSQGVPTAGFYADQFAAGLDSIDLCLFHRGYAEIYVNSLRYEFGSKYRRVSECVTQ